MIRAIEIKLIDLLSSVFVMAETDGDLRVSVPVLDHDSVEEYELKKLLILPYHYCFFFDNIFHDLCFRRLSPSALFPLNLPASPRPFAHFLRAFPSVRLRTILGRDLPRT